VARTKVTSTGTILAPMAPVRRNANAPRERIGAAHRDGADAPAHHYLHIGADRLELPHEQLTWECEQAVRSYDPCISCAAHFLHLRVPRTQHGKLTRRFYRFLKIVNSTRRESAGDEKRVVADQLVEAELAQADYPAVVSGEC